MNSTLNLYLENSICCNRPKLKNGILIAVFAEILVTWHINK